MITGIGCDIIEIERVRQAMENPRFLEEYFSQAERTLFAETGNKPETVAGNFAAKEAYVKALGTGVRQLSLRDVEVLRDELGKPYIRRLNAQKRTVHFHVSISHCKEYATATVVAEKVEL